MPSPRAVAASCFVAFLAAACTAPAASESVTSGATMSRLRATMRRPIDAASFSESFGWEYPKDHAKPTPPVDAPHETDAAAVDAAIAWIVAHFGPLPPHTSLEPTSIQRSASGNEEPQYEWDAGHTIVLHQCYHGTRTDVASVVYIRGRSNFSGHFELASFEPVDGSDARVISQDEAVEAFVRFVKQREGADAAAIEQFRRTAAPRLEFIRSNTLIGTPHQDLHVPTWSLDTGWHVDAVSGQVWRDC